MDRESLEEERAALLARRRQLYALTAKNVLCQNHGSGAYGEAMAEIISIDKRLRELCTMLEQEKRG
jgi:hypothetical protein